MEFEREDRRGYTSASRFVCTSSSAFLSYECNVLASSEQGALTYLTWRTALVLLTGSIVMLIGLAVCRLFEAGPLNLLGVLCSSSESVQVLSALLRLVDVPPTVICVSGHHVFSCCAAVLMYVEFPSYFSAI